jgi:hypothetical protein
VFLQLTGEACTGPPLELQEPGGPHAAGPAPFQRGSVDSFTLQLPALGPLTMAAVWLEGRGSPWHLDLIVVTGPQGRCGRQTMVQSPVYPERSQPSEPVN